MNRDGAKKTRIFHAKHAGEIFSIYHKLISHFYSSKPHIKKHRVYPAVVKHEARCTKSPHLFHGERHKNNHCMMRCLLHFWLHIYWIKSGARMPAAHWPLGGTCFTMATLFIFSGVREEAGKSEVMRNWKLICLQNS